MAGWNKTEMADQIIDLFEVGSYVNLGIGMPSIIAERISQDKKITIHSENGVLGFLDRPLKKEVSPTLINAGKETISVPAGGAFFDSATSFGMIRGGHIDYCVLGGMQVDKEGNLANWMIPGKKITGMGGAMDLVNGAKTVIVMMSHKSRDGTPKLVQQCTFPPTGLKVVDLIVTELGIFRPSGASFAVEKLADCVNEQHLELP